MISSGATDRPVSVIIPAHNAAPTIAMAVRSALDQPEVGEVIVIDDASADDTAGSARKAANGDPRLSVLRQARNVGPAAGRNIAIAHGTCPLIALLDADDYYLPGRFTSLLAHADWDIIADNIVFVPDSRPTPLTPDEIDKPRENPLQTVDIATFLRGNIPDSRAYRGELGFLKPVISRAFLARHDIRYDETLRLGEDFKIYVEMLCHGARFRLVSQVGYVAQVRGNSLSGGHNADDLRNLLAASVHLRDLVGDDPEVLRQMARYLDTLRARYLLHDFLEVKRRVGLPRAALHAMTPPQNALPIMRGIIRDKYMAATGADRKPVLPKRYLLPMDPSAQRQD